MGFVPSGEDTAPRSFRMNISGPGWTAPLEERLEISAEQGLLPVEAEKSVPVDTALNIASPENPLGALTTGIQSQPVGLTNTLDAQRGTTVISKRPAADWDQYAETPLPMRAAAAAQLEPVALTATATATDAVAATVTRGPEWARMMAEFREVGEKLHQDLTELRKALASAEMDRLGIGGNHPPESLDAVTKESLFAIRVVRDEVEAETFREPQMGLAQASIQRAKEKLSAWLTEMGPPFRKTLATGLAILIIELIGRIVLNMSLMTTLIDRVMP